jgi:short subunit dehydrogenase-like uncharacterized protein
MIYGANGYTGDLIAREAVRRGLKPVLAGRTAAKVEALATSLGLQARVFDLANAVMTSRGVEGMRLVLHCAGPFSATAAPMMAACLAMRAHYLDITGEISVFEHARTLEATARAASVVVCPGVGFDVVPASPLRPLCGVKAPHLQSCHVNGVDGDHVVPGQKSPPAYGRRICVPSAR